MSKERENARAVQPTTANGAGVGKSGEETSRFADSTPHASRRTPPKRKRRNGWDAMPPAVQAMRESARARREWQETIEQLEGCPRAKEFMWQLADREVSRERRVSFQWVLEETRRRVFTANDGGSFRMSNNKSPVLARLYLRERPAARRFVVLKESRFDGMEEGQ